MIGYCRSTLAIAIASPLVLTAQPVLAKQYEVRMVNRGSMGTMTFEPAFLKVAPGDTIVFLPTDKGHNVQSMPNMIPAGASGFQGRIDQPVKVTFSKAGLYAYKCLPHYAMGMVGLVQVGPAGNKAAITAELPKLPLLARKRLGTMMTQVK